MLRGAEGQEDILQEVEYRLAELFTEFMGTQPHCGDPGRRREGLRQLGEPTEFGDPDGTMKASAPEPQQAPMTGPEQRRMFRDPDDRVIGGVATGIAHRVGCGPSCGPGWLCSCSFILRDRSWLLYGILVVHHPKARR